MKRKMLRKSGAVALPAMALLAAGLLPGEPSAKATEKAAPRAEAPLAWADIAGRRYGPSEFARHRATVFLFSSTQCPIANQYTPRFNALAQDYIPRGVQFFLVNANPEDSVARLRQYARERGIAFPVIKDKGAALADRLGAQTTPQAVILDSGGTVRYLGRIDDHQERSRVVRQDAREALDAILAGRPVKTPRTLAFGCAIFRESAQPKSVAAKATVTYTRDVAAILNQNCVACHRQGEVGPFPLETYRQARAWAAAIKEYTARRIMPPWKPVPGHGAFHDARVLTDAQIATLARWADSGMPEGRAKDLPPKPRFPAPNAWKLGVPDMVLQPARDYHLEAEGKDVYRNFVLPADFTEDRYVQAMEFQPGNRAIVHHIVTYIDPTGESAKREGREKEPGYTVPGVGIGIMNASWGEVWVPGNEPRPLPPGSAVHIPKGAKLVMQVHYHKNGRPEVDRSKMALYFSKTKPRQILHTIPIQNFWFELKPGEARNVVRGDLTLPADITLHSIFPHMHMLGKEMKVWATLPDGTEKKLIYIADWDFNWQATYAYKEPVKLPKGTKLEMVAVYDNSERNPRQTSHPPRVVRFGEQTTDEMCFAFLGLTVDGGSFPVGPAAAP